MLSIKNLIVPVLSSVSLDIEAGVCITLQAPSGAGKSLLLRAIADLDPAPGEVRLDGAERGAMTGPEWRTRVRYLAAEPGFWGNRIEDHFADRGKATKLLARLGLPDDALNWPIERLSTGEKQRVALARGLEDNPAVLLLDEPTGALDAAAEEQAEALLKSRLDDGATVLLVTHDPAQAERLGRRHLTIRDGALCEWTP